MESQRRASDAVEPHFATGRRFVLAQEILSTVPNSGRLEAEDRQVPTHTFGTGTSNPCSCCCACIEDPD